MSKAKFSSATRRLIAELAVCYNQPRDVDEAVLKYRLELLMEDVEHLPEEVLAKVTKAARQTCRYMPNAAEILSLVPVITKKTGDDRSVRIEISRQLNREHAAFGNAHRYTEDMEIFVPGGICDRRGCDDATGRVITPVFEDGHWKVAASDVPAMRKSYARSGNFVCTDEGICELAK